MAEHEFISVVLPVGATHLLTLSASDAWDPDGVTVVVDDLPSCVQSDVVVLAVTEQTGILPTSSTIYTLLKLVHARSSATSHQPAFTFKVDIHEDGEIRQLLVDVDTQTPDLSR